MQIFMYALNIICISLFLMYTVACTKMSTQYATQPREELLTVPQSRRPMRFSWAERADVRSGSRRFHRPLPFFVNADLVALLKGRPRKKHAA
jgi:uncharacterized MAPEG superfamily protein